MKKTHVWAIILIIAGLVLSSTAISVPVNKNINVAEDTQFCVASSGTISPQKVTPVSLTPKPKTLAGEDVPIFVTDVPNENPAIDTDGFGNILVLSQSVTDVSSMSLLGRWSTDYGVTWTDTGGQWDFPNANTLPKMDYYGRLKTAWGTMTPAPDISGTIYYIGMPDITDPAVPDINNPDGWSAWSGDWSSNGWTNIDSADVAGYANTSNIPSPEFWGCTAVTGDVASTYTEDNTMIFSYFIAGGQLRGIYFYNMAQDLRKMSTDIDQTNGKFYLCMEYYNHATKPDGSIVYYATISTNELWWQTGWVNKYFEGVFNPDIATAAKKVYIVGEMINSSQRDIVCYHSSNSGSTFTKTMITQTTANETFPRVSLVKQLTGGYVVVVSYTRNNDLFASVSLNNGTTWTETPAVNDVAGSAVSQYSGQCAGGPYVAWTDQRQTPFGVFFDTVYTPPKPPVLAISNIKGPIGVSATLANTGETAATTVNWEIKVTGGILGKINVDKPGSFPSIAAGASEKIKSGIVLGVGKITIAITASCAEGASASASKTGMNLFFLTLGIK